MIEELVVEFCKEKGFILLHNAVVQGHSVSNPGFGSIVYGRQVVVVSIWRHRHGMNFEGKDTKWETIYRFLRPIMPQTARKNCR